MWITRELLTSCMRVTHGLHKISCILFLFHLWNTYKLSCSSELVIITIVVNLTIGYLVYKIIVTYTAKQCCLVIKVGMASMYISKHLKNC